MQGLLSVGHKLSHHYAASFGDSDLTDIYLNENFRDYIFNRTMQHVLLLVAGQLPFGLSNIWEVAFPQVDVQDFH